MDPITSIILAVTELLKEVIKSQPPDVQAELWRMFLQDLKDWRAFFGKPPLS